MASTSSPQPRGDGGIASIARLNVQQLQEQCVAIGISSEGTKTALKKRLKKALVQRNETTTAATLGIVDKDETAPPPPPAAAAASSSSSTATGTGTSTATDTGTGKACKVFLKGMNRQCRNPVCTERSELYCRFHLDHEPGYTARTKVKCPIDQFIYHHYA